MPELPEAETVCRALRKHLSGKTITRVEIFTPAMREPLTPLMEAGLEGREITSVCRRGRYVVAKLDDGRALLMHFGMSGVVRVETAAVPRRKHEHVFLYLSDGKVFRFECTRRFSVLKVCEVDPVSGWPAELNQLGPEPLESGWDGAYLFQQTRKRSGAIKNLLMDNAVVAGIGNIYATEALYRSGIAPSRSAGSLSRPECDRLAANCIAVLREAIELGGSSIADFKHVDGSEGKFSLKLAVYGKSGKPCPQCGAVIESVKLGGRTSAYCPGCQK